MVCEFGLVCVQVRSVILIKELAWGADRIGSQDTNMTSQISYYPDTKANSEKNDKFRLRNEKILLLNFYGFF